MSVILYTAIFQQSSKHLLNEVVDPSAQNQSTTFRDLSKKIIEKFNKSSPQKICTHQDYKLSHLYNKDLDISFLCIGTNSTSNAALFSHLKLMEDKFRKNNVIPIDQCGLLNGNGKLLPLLGVFVNAKIIDRIAQVDITQEYYNPNASNPQEVTFVFPIEASAAICKFQAIIDKKVIIGKCLEKQEAFEKYDDAIAEGKTAVLLESSIKNSDSFVLSLGNVQPKQKIKIKLIYVTELTVDDDGAIRFVLPKSVTPKYIGQNLSSEELKEANIPSVSQYNMNFQADISMVYEIKDIISEGYKFDKKEIKDSKAIVSFTSAPSDTNTFYMYIQQKSESSSSIRSWIETNEQTQCCMTVIPPNAFDHDQSKTNPKKEIIFLVDRSASMGGTRIKQAEMALQLFLRSIRKGAKFNIFWFGTRFDSLFPNSVPYNDNTLSKATKAIHNLQADYGGTEIYPPLKAILEKPVDKEYPREVIVLTDGEVWDTNSVIKYVTKHNSGTRIFSLGIGSGASESLVRGLARAGNGICEFTTDYERIEGKVISLLNCAISPSLTDIKLTWKTKAFVTPYKINHVYNQKGFIIYSMFDNKIREDETAILSYKIDNKIHQMDIPPKKAKQVDGSNFAIHALAAKSAIRALEEGSSQMYAQMAKDSEIKNTIISLSKKFGVVSKHTSYLAVSEGTEQSIKDPMTPGIVSVDKTFNDEILSCMNKPIHDDNIADMKKLVDSTRSIMMENIDKVMNRAESIDILALQSEQLVSQALQFGKQSSSSSTGIFSKLGSFISSFFSKDSTQSVNPSITQPQCIKESKTSDIRNKLQQIILLQKADGYWDIGSDLAQALHVPEKNFKAEKPSSCSDSAWATFVVIYVLETKFDELKDEWNLLVMKAKSWLQQQNVNTEECKAAAMKLIKLVKI